MKKIYAIIFLFFLTSNAPAFGNDLPLGKYKSLDGKIEHNFTATGDYKGIFKGSKGVVNYLGLHKTGEGICFLGGAKGNVMLYYDNMQCCLRFQSISDKLAVTRIGDSLGSSFAHGICDNQILIDANQPN
ncbi:MAG: hypothetical protein EOM20_15695 [Spartobacteria bacterium]|nr:hypothetical protein [Spartobacteria bacterium]